LTVHPPTVKRDEEDRYAVVAWPKVACLNCLVAICPLTSMLRNHALISALGTTGMAG